jgi:hypothetical protein
MIPKIIGESENVHFIDFPSMFGTQNEGLEILLDLSLQKIISQAKSTKILLVIPEF